MRFKVWVDGDRVVMRGGVDGAMCAELSKVVSSDCVLSVKEALLRELSRDANRMKLAEILELRGYEVTSWSVPDPW